MTLLFFKDDLEEHYGFRLVSFWDNGIQFSLLGAVAESNSYA
jgi:hypothetical protein